jgi:hypothetical protein
VGDRFCCAAFNSWLEESSSCRNCGPVPLNALYSSLTVTFSCFCGTDCSSAFTFASSVLGDGGRLTLPAGITAPAVRYGPEESFGVSSRNCSPTAEVLATFAATSDGIFVPLSMLRSATTPWLVRCMPSTFPTVTPRSVTTALAYRPPAACMSTDT